MTEAKEMLEKNIPEMNDTAAGNLKFQMTGNHAEDKKTFELMETQAEHLHAASKMLADIDFANWMSIMFMWIAVGLAC